VGYSPTRIDPLLLNFDFTGVCGRGTDSNGYSVRVGGTDLGWRYGLRLVPAGNDLKLMAVPAVADQSVPLEIGRTNGVANDFLKIELNQGWRLTKRIYNGQPIGHYYLTHNWSLDQLELAQTPDTPAMPTPREPVAQYPDTSPRPQPHPRPVVPTPNPLPPVQPRPVVTLPVGMAIQTRYDSNKKIYMAPNEEDTLPVRLKVVESVYATNGQLLVPYGSEIMAEVRADRGRAYFQGKELILPNGQRFGMDAVSPAFDRTERIDRGVEAETVLYGAAIGTAAATAVSALAGDSTIEVLEVLGGAGLGAIFGAIFGRQQVDLIAIDPGTQMTLTLNSNLPLD
jgi:hypothetical protein